MIYLIVLFALLGIGWLIFKKPKQNPTIQYALPIEEIQTILLENVKFYEDLSPEERTNFEQQVVTFLANHKITGIETSINEVDRVLVAASGVIPIFHFPDWEYYNLKEVLIYPETFNLDFDTAGEDRNILGMVGESYMKDKMILSQQALHFGFSNETDKKNTAIHEFVHLIDMMDGATDGIPSLLLDRPYVLPWLNLMEQKIEEIYENRSDINPYGSTNRTEFFAVASEYFFERPNLLRKKHPELFELLQKVFRPRDSDDN